MTSSPSTEHFTWASCFVLVVLLFVPGGAAVFSGCCGLKVILTASLSHCVWICGAFPVPVRRAASPCSQRDPRASPWTRCSFPTLHSHRFSWRHHMFCCRLSYLEGKGERCPAVTSWQTAPPHQGIAHTVTRFLVGRYVFAFFVVEISIQFIYLFSPHAKQILFFMWAFILAILHCSSRISLNAWQSFFGSPPPLTP